MPRAALAVCNYIYIYNYVCVCVLYKSGLDIKNQYCLSKCYLILVLVYALR